MTAEILFQVQIPFWNNQRAKGALNFSHFLSVLFLVVHASRAAPGFPRQRSAQFLSTCRRPMVKV